ncbi:MAG TPA: TonB family protein, partial [Methyloradius sp.]|nr:TonB family protein [Methyloradius sp.]
TDLMASSLDIARFEAQIAKEQDEYQKRPKRKYIGARTQEYRFATYVEAWRQKVEKIGNLNYPEAAKSQKLYGQLRMTVNIKSDGSIENISIDQSSGSKVLDDAAKNIVTMAAPYAAFPDDIRKDTDILGITRTWTFTKQDSLATEQ